MKKIVLSYLLVLCSLVAVAQTPVRVACVGNSITYGAGIENRMRILPNCNGCWERGMW